MKVPLKIFCTSFLPHCERYFYKNYIVNIIFNIPKDSDIIYMGSNLKIINKYCYIPYQRSGKYIITIQISPLCIKDTNIFTLVHIYLFIFRLCPAASSTSEIPPHFLLSCHSAIDAPLSFLIQVLFPLGVRF